MEMESLSCMGKKLWNLLEFALLKQKPAQV